MAHIDKPIVVVIQGCFQTPDFYDRLHQSLATLGYETEHPILPSCTNVDSPDFPKVSLTDDATAVRNEVFRLVEHEHKTVILTCHSYGGLVGSEAIPESLTFSNRSKEGKVGGVLHMVFFTAFLLQEGQSVLSAVGESPNNDITVCLKETIPLTSPSSPNCNVSLIIDQPDGRFGFKNAKDFLFNDFTPSEAEYWTSKLIPQSYEVQKTRLTRAAYKYIPSTYLIMEKDLANPPRAQEMFAKAADAHVERYNVGHQSMLTIPDVIAEQIVRAAERGLTDEK